MKFTQTYNFCICLKSSKIDSLVPSLTAKMKTLLILAKNSWKIEIKFSPSALFQMELELVSNAL